MVRAIVPVQTPVARRRHIWTKFVVGSRTRPCSESFSAYSDNPHVQANSQPVTERLI